MRVTCPHCHQRHDVGHMAVLQEASRLTDRARPVQAPISNVDGNVLRPDDEDAMAQKRLALQRRKA